MSCSSTPNIMLVARSLELGGAERQMVELATGLRRSGWRVCIAAFYRAGPLEVVLRNAGIPVFFLDKRGRWDVPVFIVRLVRLLRRERPDIIYSFLNVPNIVMTALRRAVPHTRLVWGVRASNLDTAIREEWMVWLEHRLGVMLSRFADLIICNSDAGRAYHAQAGYDIRNTVVIPNGIDVSRFAPDAAARGLMRGEWGIEDSEALIGVVARLHPMKGHVHFIEAAAEVAAMHPRVKFACVGDGPAEYRQRLVDLTRKYGIADRFVWSCARSDVERVYNALDIVVSSSCYGEGTSNSIAEAMATGVPCVATDVGDSAALIDTAGWICRPNDSRSLANAMDRAVRALPVDRDRVRARIVDHYGIQELLTRTMEKLNSLVTAAPQPAVAPIGLGH